MTKNFKSMLMTAGLFLASVAGTTGRLMADDAFKRYDRVQVLLHDGSDYTIRIDGESSMSGYYLAAENDYFVDVQGKDYYYRFLRSEVATVKFLECDYEEVGIKQIHAEGDSHAKPAVYRNGKLFFSAAQEGQDACFYDLSGRLLKVITISAPYSCTLEGLPSGGMIVRVGDENIKIMKP